MGGGDAAGDSFVNGEEYFPYGETSVGSFAKKRYRHRGKERDEESGLYYFGARHLIPAFGRWITCDPLGPEDSINLFQYVQSNPIRFIDSRGTDIVDIANPIRPDPVFSDKLRADQLPPQTKAAYKLLHQTNFESVIRDGLFGKSYQRRVPFPRERLDETAAQVNPLTECVPTTIRNYLRIVLRYDFDTEGIKKLMSAKSSVPVDWSSKSGIIKFKTGVLGRELLNELLPERTFNVFHTKDRSEASFLSLAQHAEKGDPVIIETSTHWYLLEGVDVVNGKNIYKVRDSNRADRGHFEFKDLNFEGDYVSWEKSDFKRSTDSLESYRKGLEETLKGLKPPPPPVDL